MYRNRNRGLKRLATAVSAVEESGNRDLGPDKPSHSRTFPSQSVTNSQRKSGGSRSPDHGGGKENQKSPTHALRATQSGAEKKRKIEYSQKKKSKAAPSFDLNDNSEFDIDLPLSVYPSKFEELVHKSGCTLREGSQRHALRKIQGVFVRKLTSLLTENEDTWDKFMDGLEKHVSNDNRFHKLLLETEMDANHGDTVGTQQDSLIRMLLGVECIQPKVIALLLTRLAELIQRDPERIRTDNRPWVLLIIKKLCFLDQVVNAQSLQRDLFRLLEVAPLASKQEIIYNLPYILGEKQDEELAACLINSMKTKKELTPVVLEALGHLPLGQDQSKEIQNKLLQSLKNTPIEFLPVICKFLFFNQNLMMADFDEVINGLRTGLPFTKSALKSLKKDGVSSSQVKSQVPSYAATEEEIASSKTITFHTLRQAVISNPKLLTAWLKNIKSVTSVYHHRPIDMVMLLVMYSTRGTARKPVESTWKNRITTGMFMESLLEETFQVLLEVLKKHVDELMDVASFLLRSPDSQVCYFGMEMYKHAFVKFESFQRRRVVRDLVGHVNPKDSVSKAALEVMYNLCNKHLILMADMTICLQGVLDKVYDLDLGSVRRIMDFLCLIAFAPDTSTSGGHIASLQDSINILIKKYLSSHQRQMKHLGVVAAIMAVKHIAASTDDSLDSTSDTLHSLSSIPAGRTCDAVTHYRKTVDQKTMPMCVAKICDSRIFDRNYLPKIRRCGDVLRNTSCVPEELGYSLDEMSLMIMRTPVLDAKFLAYLVDTIESIFMSSYLPDDSEEGSVLMADLSSQRSVMRGEDVTLSGQYGLDKEVTDPITLSIGPIVLKEARHTARSNLIVNVSSEIRPIAVLCPLFRLLRITKARSGDEDLTGIDALLGCVVSLPSPEVFDKFEDFSVSQQGDILDCLFHCVNWFREIVNAFLQVEKDVYLPKVLIRLRNIVALQKQIGRLLRHALMYTPPVCNFHGKASPIHHKVQAAKPKKKTKKRKKTKKNTDDTTLDEPSDNDTSSENEDICKHTEVEPKEVDVGLYRAYFRELDMNVFKILGTDLVLLPKPENGSDTDPEFSPLELRLLLEDLVAKLSHALGSEKRGFPIKTQPGADEGTIGFGTLNITPAEEVAANAVELLPFLLEKLECLQEANRKLLEANDGLLDGPSMFEDKVKNVKVCFGLLLKAVGLTLSWAGFQRAQHSHLLTRAVKALSTRIEVPSGRRLTFVPLLEESFNYLRNYPKCILDLQSATNFVRLLQVLSDHWERYFKPLPPTQQRKNPASEVLHEVTKTFLQQRWPSLNGQPEQGMAYNQQIEVLLQVYMTEAPDKIKLISKLAPAVSEECANLTGKDKESCLETFPVINKSNIHIICGKLLKGTVEGTIARLAEEKDSEVQLSIWETAFNIMQKIVDIVRIHPTRKNQANQLKWSEELLRAFLNKGMPVLESHLRTDQKQVINILQSSQVVTRFNHKVCCTCKISKDNSLLAYVPKVKAVMESVVYRVKSMLALHGAESAWWMGNLKNKDIADKEVGEEDDDSVLSSSIAGPSGKKSKSPEKGRTPSKSQKRSGEKGKKSAKKRKCSSPKRSSEDEDNEDNEDVDDKDSDDSHQSDETSVSLAY